jgi:hypothetical protein
MCRQKQTHAQCGFGADALRQDVHTWTLVCSACNSCACRSPHRTHLSTYMQSDLLGTLIKCMALTTPRSLELLHRPSDEGDAVKCLDCSDHGTTKVKEQQRTGMAVGHRQRFGVARRVIKCRHGGHQAAPASLHARSWTHEGDKGSATRTMRRVATGWPHGWPTRQQGQGLQCGHIA